MISFNRFPVQLILTFLFLGFVAYYVGVLDTLALTPS